MDPGATLDDLREAVTTLEETERTARRVFGGAHPTHNGIEADLRNARAALRAREAGHRIRARYAPPTPPGRSSVNCVEIPKQERSRRPSLTSRCGA